LSIAVVVSVVSPAVAKIDAADEGYVAFSACGVADDHELLVMRAAESHSLIEQDLSPRRVYLLAEVPVLLGAETEPVQVRPPEQPLDHHTSAGGLGQDGPYFGIGIVAQPLVGIAAPVREVQPITRSQSSNRFQQPLKVGCPMHQRFDPVARAPGRTVCTPSVKRGEIVAALGGREKPILL
jgi:hypothetical protein